MPTLTRVLCLSRRELVVLVLVFAASLPAVTPRLYASDEVQYFSYLRSLWFDHDVSFENEYRYFYDHSIARSAGFHETFLEPQTATGRRKNFGTLGCALLWAPFYAIADVSTRMMRAAGRDVAADGFSRPYVAAVAYGSAFYGFAAILLVHRGRAAADRAPRGDCGRACRLVRHASPLLYVRRSPVLPCVLGVRGRAVRDGVAARPRALAPTGGAIALGCAAALMAMVREQDVFFALGPAVDFTLRLGDRASRIRSACRRRRDWPRRGGRSPGRGVRHRIRRRSSLPTRRSTAVPDPRRWSRAR